MDESINDVRSFTSYHCIPSKHELSSSQLISKPQESLKIGREVAPSPTLVISKLPLSCPPPSDKLRKRLLTDAFIVILMFIITLCFDRYDFILRPIRTDSKTLLILNESEMLF